MPLDPQAQKVVDQIMALGFPPNHTVSPAEARANMNSRPRSPGPAVAKVEDHHIPGPGPDVPIRLYTPEGTGPFPVLVWFHGGGWVVGDLDTADGTARRLTVAVGCMVASVGYRLSPEVKFPGAVDDCFAAVQWVTQNAGRINADPAGIAVGGDSAGGNLAAVVSLMARDRGGPSLAFQLLVYPVIATDFETASYRQNGEGFLLSRDGMKWYWDLYLEAEADASNPYAAPILAEDLSGLPPALVITAEFDPLRDEGEAYAKRLQAAGVSTTQSRYDGMIHGFFGMPDLIDKGQQALAEASRALKVAFSAEARATSR